jgi:WD40 repeat protein
VWEFVRSASFQTLATRANTSGADVSPDGRWLAYAEATGWHLWTLAAGREVRFVPMASARSPLFHPRGQGLLLLSPNEVTQWPLHTASDGNEIQVVAPTTLLAAHGQDLQRICVSPDGERIAVTGRYRSFVFDWQKPAEAVGFAPNANLAHATLSPDRQWIVTTTHNGLGTALWDAQGRFARLLITNDNCVAAFGMDGQSLVTTSSRDYCFWDTTTWQVRRRVKLELAGAVGGPMAFSANGRLLAVAANRRDITLMHPQTGEELATLTAPDPQNLSRVAFSADGNRLVATTVGRAIHVWDLHTLRCELAGMGMDW